MPAFSYIAINLTGKRVRGSIDAVSMETAKVSLRSAGYTVIEIKSPSVLERDINIPFLGKPSAKDMAVFCRQFVSILRAGVPLSDVLGMLSQQTENKRLAAAVREIQADVEKGETLAGAMRRQNKVFTPMMVNMVAAGEDSGNLEDSFEQMEVYYDKAKKTRSAVVKAMIYPCVLLVVMLAVLVVMMTKIIPSFLETFEQMDAELPKLTQGVMAVSDWFVKWWWLLLLILVVLVVGCIIFNRTSKGRHFFGLIARKAPVFGRLSVRSACSTLTRTLSLLLGSGLTLLDSLELTANNMQNIWFEDAVHTVSTLVSEGWPLAVSLRDTGLFPAMMVNLVSVGEEAGDLQGSLAKVADYYDEEVADATARLLSLLEPAIILLMAGFVVIIVLSIFLPMLSMTHAYDQYL